MSAAHIELFNERGSYAVYDEEGFLIMFCNKCHTAAENKQAALDYMSERAAFLTAPVSQVQP